MAKITFTIPDEWYILGARVDYGGAILDYPCGTHTFEAGSPDANGMVIVMQFQLSLITRKEFTSGPLRWLLSKVVPSGDLEIFETKETNEINFFPDEADYFISIFSKPAPITESAYLVMDYGIYAVDNFVISTSGLLKKPTMRIPSEVPSKKNHIFLGWSKQRNVAHTNMMSSTMNPETGEIVFLPNYNPILDETEVAYRPGDEIAVYTGTKPNPGVRGFFNHVGAVFVPRGNLRTYIAHNGEMRPVTPFIVKDGKWTVYRSALGLQGIFEQEKTSAVFSGVLGFARLGFMRLGVNANVEKLDAPVIRLESDDTPEDDTQKLDAPVIALVTEHEKLSTPAVYLETVLEQLLAPVIELKEV